MKKLDEDLAARFFKVLGQPARIQILFVIGDGEACVCHLEAFLGLRQAAISQHLILLRKAGLVETQRDGRNIYYRLARPDILDLLKDAVRLAGLDPAAFVKAGAAPLLPCPCPHCNPEHEGGFDCSHIHPVP